MALSCLEDWIGVRGCNGNTSESGVYLNDLPGIELRIIDEVANEEDVNFAGVWAKVQINGLNRFSTDVIAAFSKKYRIKTLIQGIQIGKDITTSSTTAAAAQYRGFILELNNADDHYVMSNLQVIYLQKLSLYLPSALNTTLKVFDLDLGIELFTSSLTGASGWNEINVNTTFTARRVFCCYNSTGIASTLLDLTYVGSHDCFCNCGVTIDGAYAATGTPTTITEGNNSFGLSGVFSVQCKYDNLVCNNRELFTQPLLYALGIAFLDEAIYSPRLNRWTTTDARKMKLLRQEYEAKYKGGTITDADISMTYPGELTTAIDGITLDLKDCCLECNQQIMFKDAHV